jgi:hypothetical protein
VVPRRPRPQVGPNRLHLDLGALTIMAEEVDRLATLGATVGERFPDITVLHDPEGNEFCVEPVPGDPHEGGEEAERREASGR